MFWPVHSPGKVDNQTYFLEIYPLRGRSFTTLLSFNITPLKVVIQVTYFGWLSNVKSTFGSSNNFCLFSFFLGRSDWRLVDFVNLKQQLLFSLIFAVFLHFLFHWFLLLSSLFPSISPGLNLLLFSNSLRWKCRLFLLDLLFYYTCLKL